MPNARVWLGRLRVLLGVRMIMDLGVVVIGRNEGERLVRCLASTAALGSNVVYVDSGSTDGSAGRARSLGVAVLELDSSAPFTAARARNEGFEFLLRLQPSTRFVQFVDGDCELVPGWVQHGVSALQAHEDYGIVAGHTVERSPDASVYNRLCALEWQKDAGEVSAAGGIFMIRAELFRAAGGMNPGIIAAEDDELGLRVRRMGYRNTQIDHDMVIHDAAMTRFEQWWKRSLRLGYALAQGAHLHGGGREGHFLRQVRSGWFWGAAVPLAALTLAPASSGLSLLLLLGFPILGVRIYRYGRSRRWNPADALLYAAACTGNKFPIALGMSLFQLNRIRGRPGTLIEYKRPDEHD